MEKKIIFIDVDGTLCNDVGMVPIKAKQAIQKARMNGHRCILCTGRSKAELYEDILQIGFDGIIGAGGGYIEYQENVLLHQQFDQGDLNTLLDYFDANAMEYYIECNHGLYANEACKNHIRKLSEQIRQHSNHEGNGCEVFYNTLRLFDRTLPLEQVNKVCFLDSGHPFEKVKERFQKMFTVMPCTVEMFGKHSGEIVLKGVDKAKAIDFVVSYLQADKRTTLAIGDGHNDISMLLFADIGIAMGNASEDVKAIADFITTTHDEGGIYKAFQEYGIV